MGTYFLFGVPIYANCLGQFAMMAIQRAVLEDRTVPGTATSPNLHKNKPDEEEKEEVEEVSTKKLLPEMSTLAPPVMDPEEGDAPTRPSLK